MDSTLKIFKNKHLTSSECHKLEILLKTKTKVREIARNKARYSRVSQ